MHDDGYDPKQRTDVIEEICLMNRKFESPITCSWSKSQIPGGEMIGRFLPGGRPLSTPIKKNIADKKKPTDCWRLL